MRAMRDAQEQELPCERALTKHLQALTSQGSFWLRLGVCACQEDIREGCILHGMRWNAERQTVCVSCAMHSSVPGCVKQEGEP